MKEISTAVQTVQPKRIFWPDALRVAAIFAVMVVHQAATGYTEAPAGSIPWAMCLAYNTAARFAVPAFVMISGAMYLDQTRNVTMAHILRKIRKLAATFFVWSAAYGLAGALEEHRLFTADLIWPVMQKVVTGHYHMWYLYLIAALYLLTPLLRKLTSGRRRLWWLSAAAFLLGCAAGNAGKLFTYIGYYCLGHELCSAGYTKHQAGRICCASLPMLAVAAVAAAVSGCSDLAFQEKMPHIILFSAGIFLAFRAAAQDMEKLPAVKRLVETIAPCTFGMYLVHPVFNYILRKVGLYGLTFTPLICVPLCSALVFVSSLSVIFLIRKFPVFRYIT